jgi:hypothetical protein
MMCLTVTKGGVIVGMTRTAIIAVELLLLVAAVGTRLKKEANSAGSSGFVLLFGLSLVGLRLLTLHFPQGWGSY